jgi:hypothetical protein
VRTLETPASIGERRVELSDRGAERFVFAIPLKGRDACADWEATQANLRRTIRAARAAAGAEGALLVIGCHDKPDLGDADGTDVHALTVPFRRPTDPAGGTRDKSRKRRFIGAWLRQELSPSVSLCVMFLDADDLVHRDLVAFVRGSDGPSFIVDDGYIFDANVGLLFRIRVHFHRICGSSFICRFRWDELPTSWEDVTSPFAQFGSSPEQRGHQDYDAVASELGKHPVPVPFPAVVYYANHAESLWIAKDRPRRRVSDPRDLLRRSVARQILTHDFNAEDLGERIAGRMRLALALARAARVLAAGRLGSR